MGGGEVTAPLNGFNGLIVPAVHALTIARFDIRKSFCTDQDTDLNDNT